MKVNRIFSLILWIVLFESIGFSLGRLTEAGIYPWYTQLDKSTLTPPGIVFSIVWSLLYVLLAVVAWRISSVECRISRQFIGLFWLQMLMNWAWTPLFFTLHWIIFSAFWLLMLVALNFVLVLMAKRRHRLIAWLLLPYLLWLLFAAFLNLVIVLKL